MAIKPVIKKRIANGKKEVFVKSDIIQNELAVTQQKMAQFGRNNLASA
jgi:hypothetical protein